MKERAPHTRGAALLEEWLWTKTDDELIEMRLIALHLRDPIERILTLKVKERAAMRGTGPGGGR